MKKGTIVLLFLCLLPALALGEGVIRLHIIAPSDSAEDQAMKLAVRDEVLAVIRGQGAGECFEDLRRLKPQMVAAARRAGYEGDMTLQTGLLYFDRRELGGREFPAGFYPAARLVMGQGKGRNWWGLLNPDFTQALLGDGEIVWYTPRIISLWFII